MKWKDVTGYEGYYEVSSCGKVRSVTRISTQNRIVGGVIRKQPLDNYGYPVVCLSKDGKQTTHKVHRLVAFEFCKGYRDGLTVNHKDEVKTNNNFNNLEWMTKAENSSIRSSNGSEGIYFKVRAPDGEIFECKNITSFARKHDLISNCLSRVIKGSRQSHKGWTAVC